MNPPTIDLLAVARRTCTGPQLQVLHALYIDGLTHRQAAIELGISKGAVTDRHERALERIRRHLETHQ